METAKKRHQKRHSHQNQTVGHEVIEHLIVQQPKQLVSKLVLNSLFGAIYSDLKISSLFALICTFHSLDILLAQAAAQAAADLTAMSIMSPNGTKPKKKAFDAQKIYAAAAADLSGSSIQFRVRGSQEGDDWIAPVEEVDQEEVLRKELAKAQKKLRKQQQLQEWMREKEEKAMLQQKEAEDVRLAQQKDEQDREKKRKAREKKLKRKINGYHDQIKTEAEKIQELMDMGIDPESLF